jgi:hypothetical protein
VATDPRVLDPTLYITPRRELGDTKGTVRVTDCSGGYDDQKAELYYGDQLTRPTYWEAQNINSWDRPGQMFLCKAWNRIGSVEGTDHEYLLYPFNLALYRFCTANHDATLNQKITTALGVPAWAALTNVYPGATAVRNAVGWRSSLYIASGENLLRVMSTSEGWTTLAAPGAVGAALAGQVGVGFDDKLVVWWEGAGLYTYDGTTWVKIYPALAGVTPTDPYCDLMFMGPGSFQFFTRDVTGVTSWREYSIETTGTFIAQWFAEPGYRVWPQSGMTFQGEAWNVGRMGSHRNIGILWAKKKLQAPEPIAVLDTNLATADQRGLDWAWRSLFAVGDIAWIGGSSRQDRNAGIYHFEVDEDGELINPGAVIGGVGGPIYSIGMLPYGATGANTTERLFISVGSATYYKDADDDSDPLTDAAIGMQQYSDFDLGLEDHLRIWADFSAYLLEQSVDGQIEFQYRVDGAPDDSWTALDNTQNAIDNFLRADAPDDDATLSLTGTRTRILQIRAVWTRPNTGTERDILDTLAVRFAALIPLGSQGV